MKTTKLSLLSSLALGSFILTACQPTPQKETVSKVITPAVAETIVKDPTPPPVLTIPPFVFDNNNLTAEQLSNFRWELYQATDSNQKAILPLMDKAITAGMEIHPKDRKNPQIQETIYFSAGCNSMQGKMTLKNNQLTPKRIMTTEKGCPSLLGKADNQLASLMNGTSKLSVENAEVPILTQVTESKAKLVWKGKRTARSRYAQEPELVYLAIAPETKPCSKNTTRQCLQIKPVNYEQLKKIDTGDWELYDGTIERYTHDSNHEQVIRAERYTLNSSNQPKYYAYVLSQVIESASVK